MIMILDILNFALTVFVCYGTYKLIRKNSVVI